MIELSLEVNSMVISLVQERKMISYAKGQRETAFKSSENLCGRFQHDFTDLPRIIAALSVHNITGGMNKSILRKAVSAANFSR